MQVQHTYDSCDATSDVAACPGAGGLDRLWRCSMGCMYLARSTEHLRRLTSPHARCIATNSILLTSRRPNRAHAACANMASQSQRLPPDIERHIPQCHVPNVLTKGYHLSSGRNCTLRGSSLSVASPSAERRKVTLNSIVIGAFPGSPQAIVTRIQLGCCTAWHISSTS